MASQAYRGLIRSKYERDYGWKDQWVGYDPATRSDFYARAFTGEFVIGIDNLVTSMANPLAKKVMLHRRLADDLEPFRNSLLYRRKYERLACRPLNRLFLPKEHL
jgi:hypothetical protein